MADLLANLEVGLSHSTGTSERLRSIISTIEWYMRAEGQPWNVSDSMPEQLSSSYGNYNVNPGLQAQRSIPGTEPDHIQDTEVHFELPMELLADWPWSSDFNQFTA